MVLSLRIVISIKYRRLRTAYSNDFHFAGSPNLHCSLLVHI